MKRPSVNFEIAGEELPPHAIILGLLSQVGYKLWLGSQ